MDKLKKPNGLDGLGQEKESEPLSYPSKIECDEYKAGRRDALAGNLPRMHATQLYLKGYANNIDRKKQNVSIERKISEVN